MGEGKVESVRPEGEIPAGFSATFTGFSQCLGESPTQVDLGCKRKQRADSTLGLISTSRAWGPSGLRWNLCISEGGFILEVQDHQQV